MYGEVPKGAPLRCRLGHHVGQERGGLMCFQCGRCGGTFPQTDPRYRGAMDAVRALEDLGDVAALANIAEAGYADEMTQRTRDHALYGYSVIGTDGERVDPRDIRPSP